MTAIEFPLNPGPRVRQLQRQYKNPLFEQLPDDIFAKRLQGAQYMDKQDEEEFEARYHQIVYEIANLEQTVSSEQILSLKEQLDLAYEQCVLVAGEQLEKRHQIAQLLEMLMQAIWRGAKGDPQAEQNLHEEETARKEHFQLLECVLVADILSPQSFIKKEDFIPVLLSVTREDLSKTYFIFDFEQRRLIANQAEQFLSQIDPQTKITAAWAQLAWIKNQS